MKLSPRARLGWRLLRTVAALGTLLMVAGVCANVGSGYHEAGEVAAKILLTFAMALFLTLGVSALVWQLTSASQPRSWRLAGFWMGCFIGLLTSAGCWEMTEHARATICITGIHRPATK